MTQLGKLPPLYRFISNPFEDVRFSTCPECSQRTLLRKVPLVVHVDPIHPVVLNKHCRYCPDCDLLIAHQDELEKLLVFTFQQRAPEVIGNDYLVLGTVDKATWRKQQKEPIPMGRLPELLHDFKEVLTLQYAPGGWYPNDQPPAPREAPPPAKSAGWQAESTSPNDESPVVPALAIDDPKQAETLLAKMEALLPIPAEVRRSTANYLRAQGSFIPPHRQVSISNVLYHGDEGGIVCGISPKNSKEAVVISLTHLKIPYSHPLEKEIRSYQKARLRKIG
ncbi:MAG: hypothetical protein ISS57_05755 [Anaerolineales bacterium]|nr:hypothetical protein [Chloroflexota bacterium]MBL7162090.1 hypothetical protein [Anaerolineales bacterium]